LGQYVGMGMDRLRYLIGFISKHLDVQIAQVMSEPFSGGLPESLVGNSSDPVNMGLKGLQLCSNSIMPYLMFQGQSLALLFPTHAEGYNQNVKSQGQVSANLARRSTELLRWQIAISLVIFTQAADLRSFLMQGHYDPRNLLSAETRKLYSAVRQVLNQPPSKSRPLVWNDRDVLLDSYINAVKDDLLQKNGVILASCEEAVRRLDDFVSV
jgi:phenylalanine ammonia-lyase